MAQKSLLECIFVEIYLFNPFTWNCTAPKALLVSCSLNHTRNATVSNWQEYPLIIYWTLGEGGQHEPRLIDDERRQVELSFWLWPKGEEWKLEFGDEFLVALWWTQVVAVERFPVKVSRREMYRKLITNFHFAKLKNETCEINESTFGHCVGGIIN